MDQTEKVNILMVDDHPENLRALEAILGDLGQNLVIATSGRDALRALLRQDFAVILLDVQMPGMDGFEAASLIRERKKHQHTPIIFLTAMDKNEKSVFRGYSVGAVDYIFKPFEPEILRAKVSVFIELFRKTEKIKRQAAMLTEANHELDESNKSIKRLNQALEGKNLEIQGERDFINAVIDTAGSYVVVFDTEGRILRCNNAFQEASGYDEDMLRGHCLWDLFLVQEEIEEVQNIFDRVRGGEYPITSENYWVTKNGTPRTICWTSTALRNEHGHVEHIIGTGIDFTARKKAEEEIKKLNDALENRVRERTAQLEDTNRELRSEIAVRHRTEEALRASEARFRRLFESNMIGINFADLDGNIVQANDAFLSIVGHSAAELGEKGLNWKDLTPPEYHEIDQRALDQLRSTGVCVPYEKEYVRGGDGTRIPILIGRALLEGPDSLSVSFVVDLTELKRAEVELKSAKEAAEAANNAKDHFLAVLSHELRTPLTPILTTVQVLEDDRNLPDDLRFWVEIIRTNIELEARLIDDLLDLTRITQGKLALNLTTADIHALVGSVLEICKSDIQAKELRINLEMNAKNSLVRGDAARLQQVLWNLIKNSIKFTPAEGTITISTESRDDNSVRILVRDNGIGIEPEILPRIFDAFEQGDKKITRNYGGLGLGLAISKTLIDLHGGTLGAHSEGKDHGATFTIELATTSTEQIDERRQEVVENSEARNGNIKILIVEDNLDTSQVMQHLLTRRGYQVYAVSSMTEALEAASLHEFDLMISDIGLPDGSGIELMEKMRASRPIKAIAVSGYGMEEDIRRSHEAGFLEHLTKPISFSKLSEVIRTMLS